MDERDVTTADAEPAEETPLVVPEDDGGAAEEGAREKLAERDAKEDVADDEAEEELVATPDAEPATP